MIRISTLIVSVIVAAGLTIAIWTLVDLPVASLALGALAGSVVVGWGSRRW